MENVRGSSTSKAKNRALIEAFFDTNDRLPSSQPN